MFGTRLGRRAKAALAVALAALAAYALGSWAAARHLTAPHRTKVDDPPGHRRITLEGPRGVRLAASLRDVPGARGTVVLAHGLRNDRRLLLGLSPLLAERGLRVLAFDFEGHGESTGDRVTLGADEARDVAIALDHARSLGGHVLFVGFSMGAAAYLLAGNEARAAVLDSPYASLDRALATRLSAAHVPPPLGALMMTFYARRIGRSLDSVRPADRASALASPTLLIFAERDHWVSAESRAIFAARAGSNVTIDVLAGKEHAGHFDEAWSRRVVAFLVSAIER